MHRELGPPPRRPRTGLTLVELLVAVGIVAMLVGLLTPALMGARRSALNAKVKSEIDMLHMALMNYKSEYGSFPPANFGSVPNVGPLWTGNAVNTRHPAYRHLVRIFPRLSELTNGPNSPYLAMSKMSPAQALVFWLRGFYENPEFPLTNNGQPGQRKKLFDFDESRLYGASEYTVGEAQDFSLRSDAAAGSFRREYPVYFTGQPTSGLPYVYFDARCYDVPNGDVSYQAMSYQTKEVSTAFPYVTSDIPSNPLWSQCHVNADTFQLIASGLDGRYGPVGATSVSAGQASYPLTVKLPPGAEDDERDPADTLSGHGDNITNFASKPLAAAIKALQNDQ